MLIRNLKVSRLLSFGPEGIDLPMRPLNVLIGANGCGKSNFVEVLNLLRYAPVRFDSPIMTGGGIKEWLWKGGERNGHDYAEIEVVLNDSLKVDTSGFFHNIAFGTSGDQVLIEHESILHAKISDPVLTSAIFYEYRDGHVMLQDNQLPKSKPLLREIHASKLDFRVSILSQMRDPDRYRVFDYLQRRYNGIQIYREWTFGPGSTMRSSQLPDAPSGEVGRAGKNIVSVIASMKLKERNRLVEELACLYEEIEDVQAKPAGGGALRLFIEEKGGREISAERLSDGTLRYLFLLAILLQPEPPPMIVIEEPELGLHPDVIPKLAALLIEASARSQIVVTTHSRMLIDALDDDPESVVVCEKHNGQSTFERLDGERMKVWLEKYSLGELWSKGEIGGNRW
ncbi:MAG: AAA family ATPase [Verrucomicrobiota bacterium]